MFYDNSLLFHILYYICKFIHPIFHEEQMLDDWIDYTHTWPHTLPFGVSYAMYVLHKVADLPIIHKPRTWLGALQDTMHNVTGIKCCSAMVIKKF